ncbi:MAG: Nudix hydrolase [Verrucomicrobiales bacterium]|nr:Nudix hydrolase [Verrucomicrobiales bacterium]
MAEEIFDVVNGCDEVVHQETRKNVHRLGLKHRAVHIMVFNHKGHCFLQKRSMTKDTFPGTWDSSSSGHVDTGEHYDQCAIRELREELGLVVHEAPEALFKVEACEDTGQEFVWVYQLRSEGPFILHPEEIEEGSWFEPEVVTKWMLDKPQEFARALVYLWPFILAHPRSFSKQT